ncbi:uncharacterized protein [Amphiura filiformis]|uniref:uncharacterized protein n=1 Tax=Amphiura filiformis TaxID=82378 RepID=UPI003B20E7DC
MANNVWMSRMAQLEQQEEPFKPFEDYLGLVNLVKNLNSSLNMNTDSTTSTNNAVPCCSANHVCRSRTTSTSSAHSAEELFSWDEFKLNGVDVDDDGAGFQPFAPRNTRKLVSRLPSAKNRRTPTWCVFCKNNGESEMVYGAHILKDSEGRTSCPILRNYTCPICGVSGDGAHTIKYCPLNKEETFPPSIGLLKTARTSTGKKRDCMSSMLDRLN